MEFLGVGWSFEDGSDDDNSNNCDEIMRSVQISHSASWMGEYPEANRDEREDPTSAGRPQGWTKTFFLETLSHFFRISVASTGLMKGRHGAGWLLSYINQPMFIFQRVLSAIKWLITLLYKPTNVHISKIFISDQWLIIPIYKPTTFIGRWD